MDVMEPTRRRQGSKEVNILITGHKGYIGSVLTEVLIRQSYTVLGYDTDYYAGCEVTSLPQPSREIKKDIRDVTVEDLRGIDAVIHLAALSNDPLGELDSRLTDDINLQGTFKLARCAREAGVKRFIFSSSPSMYGIAKADGELDEDHSEKNPLTAYAKTKWEAECDLKKLSSIIKK